MSGNETDAKTLLTVYLGPSAPDFISSCFHASPGRFLFLWATGFAAVGITLVIAGSHHLEMLKSPASMQRVYYKRVNWFAPVLALTAFFALLSPRANLMMKMLQSQAEAIALYSFGDVLFVLCAGEALQHATAAAEPTVGAKMLAALNEQGPQAYFAVPPFGCCFIKCIRTHLLKPWHIITARFFVRQYTFIVVGGGMLRMWFALCLTPHKAVFCNNVIEKITKLAGLVCLYGLFILYKATHDLLEKWRPTMKFVSLKLVIVLMVYQDWFVAWLVDKFPPLDEHCLGNPKVHGLLGEDTFQKHNRERFNNMWLVALESVLVAYLVRNAFPSSELKETTDTHSMLLQLDLERLHTEASEKRRARRRDGDGADEDVGSSDEESDEETASTLDLTAP